MLTKLLGRLLGAIAAGIVAVGCVTTEQVENIVNDANREAVLASVAGPGSTLEPEQGSTDASTWQQTVNRIEDFIAGNPNEVRTNNALRIREAVVLINAKQLNLARAAFSEVDRDALSSVRDLAIYDAREHLIWWYGWDGSLAGDNERRAREALVGLAAVADGIDRETQIRRFLEEVRVRIAVTLARGLPTEEEIRGVLDEAMPRFAAQFDADDRVTIQAWHMQGTVDADGVLRSLRWFDYAPRPFSNADAAFGGRCATECPTYTPDWIACIDNGSC